MPKIQEAWIVTAIYLIFGITWIVLTDFLVDRYFNDFIIYSTVKGIIFVGLSSLVIYFAIVNQYKKRRKLEYILSEESRKKLLYKETLSEQNKRLYQMIEKAPLPMVLHAENKRILIVSDAFTELTGYRYEEVPTINAWLKKAYGDKSAEMLNYIENLYSISDHSSEASFAMTTKDYKPLLCDYHSAFIGYDENGLKNILTVIIDATDYHKKEKSLTYLAEHDDLTKLWNKRFYERFINDNKHSTFSFVLTDINGLKLINDLYGHQKGDELLIHFAEILRDHTSKDSKICRLGGDEFAIFSSDTSQKALNDQVTKIQKMLLESELLDVKVSASFGYAIKTPDKAFTQVYAEAEYNLYSHKTHTSSEQSNLVLKSLMKTLFEQSDETNNHLEQLMKFAEPLMSKLSFDDEQRKDLELLIKIHDIGKINLSSEIFKLTTQLKEGMLEEIKKHPEYGYRIANALPQLKSVAYAILTHHENIDGSGYPFGIKGSKIPYLSRVLRILDSYETMTSGRLYKKKKTAEEAASELRKYRNIYYDETIVETFLETLENTK